MKIIPPEALLSAYAQGIFPMAESRDSDDVDWYSASQRGIIPIEGFHVSKNVKRIIRQRKFDVKVDTQFREVAQSCANRETTWINDLILNSYDVLNQAGHAHSVEVYLGKKLVGGLYGVSLKAAFFGESMFKIEPEADKVALFFCYHILKKNGFKLWDTQFYTDHLAQFGCIEIDAEEYQQRLLEAMKEEKKFTF
ncbi:MAG: leucyl/phenylalanyl-tRNA--protein transferase [Balneolaceae bacterium]